MSRFFLRKIELNRFVWTQPHNSKNFGDEITADQHTPPSPRRMSFITCRIFLSSLRHTYVCLSTFQCSAVNSRLLSVTALVTAENFAQPIGTPHQIPGYIKPLLSQRYVEAEVGKTEQEVKLYSPSA